MGRVKRILLLCIMMTLIFSGCSTESEREEWQQLRYYFDTVGSCGDNITFTHPQTQKTISGDFTQLELVLPDDAEREDIAKLAMALCQNYIDEYYAADEENRKYTVGLMLDIYQYGEALAEDVILIPDENGKYLQIFQRDSEKSITGTFITLQEFSDSLNL